MLVDPDSTGAASSLWSSDALIATARSDAERRPNWLVRNMPAVLDIGERLTIFVLFGNFAVRFLLNFESTGDFVGLLMVVSEVALVVLILVRRKATLVSDQPIDWALGLAGTCSALLVTPTELAPLAPSALWLTLILFGMFLQIYAKFALARSFGIIAANRGIKMGGPYALIRHPMYAGYTISHIGFWLAYPSFTNAAIYLTGLALQIARIVREEALLSRDERYVEFMKRVRYRLLPGIF